METYLIKKMSERKGIPHKNLRFTETVRADAQATILPKITSDNALMGRLNKINPIQEYVNLVPSIMSRSGIARGLTTCKTTVRAAGVLRKNSSTEIIGIDRLSQRNTSRIQYIEIADVMGRLYCVDSLVSTSCWLRIITMAKDIHSCNVLLTTDDKGIFLKTVKDINPGESLQMWFTEDILGIINMPFLTPKNIRGENHYVCHNCNKVFEYPNPLKLHMLLNCNKLDNNHIWTLVVKRLASFNSSKSNLSRNLYTQTTFTFDLTSAITTIGGLSPNITKTTYSTSSRNNSPKLSNQLSPLSLTRPISTQISSTNQLSPSSSNIRISCHRTSEQITPNENLTSHRSAFKPYQDVHRKNCRNRTTPYDVHDSTTILRNDMHTAEMETIVSSMGKSKEGHRCIYCGKLYTRKYGLKIHIRTHTGYKPLKCNFCLRAFGDPSNLNKHVRLHADGDTPYKCDVCGKVMVRRRDLERHLRSRHQQGVENVSEGSSDANDVV